MGTGIAIYQWLPRPWKIRKIFEFFSWRSLLISPYSRKAFLCFHITVVVICLPEMLSITSRAVRATASVQVHSLRHYLGLAAPRCSVAVHGVLPHVLSHMALASARALFVMQRFNKDCIGQSGRYCGGCCAFAAITLQS